MKQTNSRPSAGERARVRRLKAAYRKRMLIVGVIFFILGIVAGALVHSWYAGRHEVTATPAVSPAPVPEAVNPFGTDLDEDETGAGAPQAQTAEVTDAPTEAPTPEPEPTEAPTPEVTEAPKPVIKVPVTAEPTQASQPAIEVPETAPTQAPEEVEETPAEVEEAPVQEDEAPAVAAAPAEGEPQEETEEEPEEEPDELEFDEAESGEDEAPAEDEASAEAPQQSEPEATPVPDMASGDVDEFDPAEGEVPVEYTLDQETLADPEAAQAAVAQAEAPAAQDEAPAGDEGPQVIAVVPCGESYTYATQIKLDGSARVEADGDPYETLHFTQTMKEYLRPSDFANRYATEYRLQGDEAGAGFELVLNDYIGTATIIPQNVIDVGFCSATGNTVERGYQLMDKVIGGNYDVRVESDTPKTLFKRYAYSSLGEEMKYLVVTTYNNGRQDIILFELESDAPPEAEIVYPIIQRGLKSDDVKNMQERLIEMGYLSGKADGDFGPATEKAVKEAQEAFGLEPTGTADNEFQQKLYEGMASKPIPTTMQTPEPAASEDTEG